MIWLSCISITFRLVREELDLIKRFFFERRCVRSRDMCVLKDRFKYTGQRCRTSHQLIQTWRVKFQCTANSNRRFWPRNPVLFWVKDERASLIISSPRAWDSLRSICNRYFCFAENIKWYFQFRSFFGSFRILSYFYERILFSSNLFRLINSLNDIRNNIRSTYAKRLSFVICSNILWDKRILFLQAINVERFARKSLERK